MSYDNHNTSAIKTLQILQLLARKAISMSATFVASELGMERSSVYRSIKSLENTGFVVKNNEKQYSVSVKLYALAKNIGTLIDKEKYLQDYLDDASEKLNVDCLIGAPEGKYGIVTHISGPDEKTDRAFTIGDRSELHCAAVGRALLANSSKEATASILEQGLTKKTEKTITDKFHYLKTLSKIKDVGYAIDCEEVLEGVNCLSVPIVVGNNYAELAFDIVSTSQAMPEALAREYVGSGLIEATK